MTLLPDIQHYKEFLCAFAALTLPKSTTLKCTGTTFSNSLNHMYRLNIMYSLLNQTTCVLCCLKAVLLFKYCQGELTKSVGCVEKG